MNEILWNYPDDWGTDSDWEYLSPKCYCERCGKLIESEDDGVDTGECFYCNECYDEKYGENEDEM